MGRKKSPHSSKKLRRKKAAILQQNVILKTCSIIRAAHAIVILAYANAVKGLAGVLAKMKCPEDDAGLACTGHGRCLSMRRAAELNDVSLHYATSYSFGMQTKMGMRCDPGYTGFTIVLCGRVRMVNANSGVKSTNYYIECDSTCSGTFKLTFRGRQLMQLLQRDYFAC